MKKGYKLCKNKKTSQIVIINYDCKGFNVKPLNNKIKYPGVKVNSIMMINPNFIEKVLKKKIKRKIDKFVSFMITVVEDEDTDAGDVVEALNELARYRSIVVNKYKKYLEEKYTTLLLKKLDFLERELKQKVIFLEEDTFVEENSNRRTR